MHFFFALPLLISDLNFSRDSNLNSKFEQNIKTNGGEWEEKKHPSSRLTICCCHGPVFFFSHCRSSKTVTIGIGLVENRPLEQVNGGDKHISSIGVAHWTVHKHTHTHSTTHPPTHPTYFWSFAEITIAWHTQTHTNILTNEASVFVRVKAFQVATEEWANVTVERKPIFQLNE